MAHTSTAHPNTAGMRTSKLDALHQDGVNSVNMKKHPRSEGGTPATSHKHNGAHLMQKIESSMNGRESVPATLQPGAPRSGRSVNGTRQQSPLIAQQQSQYPPGTGQKMYIQQQRPAPVHNGQPPIPQGPLGTQQSPSALKKSHHDLLRQHNEELKQQKAKKDALKESQASFGRYAAVDSKYFNLILPVLPRAEDIPKT